MAIRSRTDKLAPIYYVDIRYRGSRSSSKEILQWREFELSAPFSQWFTVDGVFVNKSFHNWFASNISKLDDPKSKAYIEESGTNDQGFSKDTSKRKFLNSDGNTVNPAMRSRRRG